MSPPKISVLVPTYNYGRYLPEAIESILEQDWEDFEVLISDDASADNSTEIIARYAAKDSRIRFQIHTANLGMVQNWNWCLSQARGEYVKYLFGDDKFASRHALRTLVKLLEDNPSVTLAASARYVIGETSAILDIWDDFNQPGLHAGNNVIAQCLDANRNLIGEPSVVLFRRGDAARGFDVRYRQIVDLEMWLHLLERGDFAYVSEPLCCFRRHPRQQTEVNKLDSVGNLEGLRHFAEYRSKLGSAVQSSRQRLFARVFDLRKLRKRSAEIPPEVIAMERDFMAELGQRWYAAYYLHRRITKPFKNLHRWIRRWRQRAALGSALRGRQTGASAGSPSTPPQPPNQEFKPHAPARRLGLKAATTPPSPGRQPAGANQTTRQAGAPAEAERSRVVRHPGQRETVLFLSHEASRTGAPILLLQCLRWLRQNTDLPFRILLRSGGPLEGDFRSLGETFVAGQTELDERLFRDTALIYSNTCTNGPFLNALPCSGIPVVTHIHELRQSIASLVTDSLQAVKQHTQRFIACSDAVARDLREAYQVPAEKISRIYGGVPVDSVIGQARETGPDQVRGGLGIPQDAFVVGACGPVVWHKGPELFIRAAKHFKQQAPQGSFIFLWIGSVFNDPLGQALLREIVKLGLEDCVRFVGQKANPYPLLNACDVFCLPSRTDSFPLVMLEAAALGKPTICFDHSGGAVEFCVQGGGFAEPYLNTQAMARRCLHLMANTSVRREVAAQAARLVREKFDVKVTAARVWELIRSFTASAGALSLHGSAGRIAGEQSGQRPP